MDPVPAEPGLTPSAAELDPAAPPVVAVLVTHDPGPWFAETLASLAAQTYPELSVLVIDTASDIDPTDEVRALLPEAHVHVLDHDPGIGAAFNLVRDLVEGASFYAFCHDDIALDPDAVRTLVEEAFRSNAGIIGPKLVTWDDPMILLQVGMGADKTGMLAPVTERGELDQEQQDGVRDVFVVPGVCTLVRTDLFNALGGFDDGIDRLGEDLDLCWRAHVAGARVMIGPAARVRHLEAMGLRHDNDDRRRLLARYRLRTSLIAYGPVHRLRVMPQAAVLAVIEMIYAVVSGHPGQARDIGSAWTWNLRRSGEIRRRRKALKGIRLVPDKEVRALQVSGSARVSAYMRGQFRSRDDRVTTFARSSRDMAGAMRDGSRQFTGTFAIVLGLLLAISSRDLLVSGIPAIGEFARFPDSPRPLIEAWWSGWQRGGLGGSGAQPTGYGILGLLGMVFFGAMSVLRTVLILGTIPIGAIGAWRLARPIGSARASVAAFAVYLAIPVPYNALASGSWSGLLVYAVSPWLLLAMGRAAGIAPFAAVAAPVPADPDAADPGDQEIKVGTVPRSPVRMTLGLGLVLAVVAAFVPAVLVVALIMVLAIAFGSLLCFRVAGVARMLAITLGAVAVALLLHVPWSLDLLRSPSPWEALAGNGATNGGILGLGRILRFETGPWGAPPLGWAFLLAGALPVIIGRSWRLEWAVRAWMIILAGWGILWLAQEGVLPFGLPADEVVLAPVAAALSLTAALGLAAFEIDLRAYRFGWRQVLAVAAALGVVLGAVPLAAGLVDGRWRTPSADYSGALGDLLDTEGRAPFRVLWLGDPDVLPAASWRLDEQAAYAATDRGVPTVLDRFPGAPPGATPLIADAVREATGRRTTRLGHLLAPMGVRYLVLPSRLAPASSDGAIRRPPSPELTAALAQQLDLEAVPVAEGLVVYRNIAWAPSRSVLPDRAGDRTSFLDAVADDLAGARAAVPNDVGAVDASGRVPKTGDLLQASTADANWRLRIDGVPMKRSTTYGWANQFTATRAGSGSLVYDTPISRTLATAGQVVMWVLVVLVWWRRRRIERTH